MWTLDRYQAGGVGAKVVQHGDRGHSLQLNHCTAYHRETWDGRGVCGCC